MQVVSESLSKTLGSVSVGASETNTVASDVIKIDDPLHILLDIDVTSISDTTGITATLQDSMDNSTWNSKGSEGQVSITGTAEVQTLTVDTKANTTDGDYIVITDTAGDDWAVAFDTTGGSANTPTGAVWAAIPAGRKAEADISGDTTAAQVAATVETTFNSLTGFSAVVTTDDTAADGTMTFTAVTAGPDMADGQVLAKDDTAAGTPALAISTTTAPVATGTFTIRLLAENSSDQSELPLRPFIRVVVSSGASDAVTVSKVTAAYSKA